MKRKKHPRPTTLRQQLLYFFSIFLGILILYLIFFPIIYTRRYPLSATATMKQGDLLYTLEMKKTSYRPGERIGLRLALKNVGTKPIKLHFQTDGYADFVVQRDVNLLFFHYFPEVWRHLYEDAVYKVSRTIAIAPGGERFFEASWDQKDYAGRPSKPGRYIITGILNTSGKKPELKISGTTE